MAYSRRILRILLLAFVGMAGLGLQGTKITRLEK